jgi:calcineurin-like phosphoesterase family protein
MHVWRNSHRGAFHLYGHTHGELKEQTNLSFDCGQDAWNFRPVSIEEVIEKMEKKKALGHEDPTMEKVRKKIWGHDAVKGKDY